MKKKLVIILTIVCFLLCFFSLFIGSYDLSVDEILHIFSSTDTMNYRVFIQLRMPRAIMGLLAGFVLGLAGSVYQMLFRNPLASPDLTGVASGASLGAACMIVLGSSSLLSLTLGAFVAGMLALVLVLLLVKASGGRNISSYVLAGIVVSAIGEAGIMILKYMADPLGELAAIEFWTMGSLASITLDKMLIAFISAIIPLVCLLLSNRQLILLSMGDEQARYLGLQPKRARFMILILTTWMVASIISLTGVISFVGLIAPHIAYLILKKRTHTFLWLSGIMGAIVLMISDIFARSLLAGGEIPLSIFTIFFSTPILIVFMLKQRGKWV